MSAKDRAPATQFYWRDWLVDDAVQRMTFDEQGRYFRVLCMTHQNDTPGVCREEDVMLWACYTPGEWKLHRAALARAFKIDADGLWIQKRTVQEREGQLRRFELSQKGGRRSASRPRNPLGQLGSHLEPHLDVHLEPGLGTPSSSSSTSSSMRRDPTPPFPAERPSVPRPASDRVKGKGAQRAHGIEAVGDVLARAVPGRGGGGEIPNGTTFSDAFIGKQQRHFPDVEVFRIAKAVDEDARRGELKDRKAVLIYRCKEIQHRATRGRVEGAAERDRAGAANGSQIRPVDEVPPRGAADQAAASTAPLCEGQHEEP